MRTCRLILPETIFALFFCSIIDPGFSQQPVRPITVGQPMPDFTLPVYQGGEFKFSSVKGKTVVLVFPRGMASKDGWCHVCNYQYAELADAEKTQQIRKKYGIEILYIFPYAKTMIDEWIDKYPNQLVDIEVGKNPPKGQQLDERASRRAETYKREFPKNFQAKKGEVPTPFPILLDADRTLSKGLGIFAEEWSGSRVDQNIPSIYIVDAMGILQFKYISQNTFDRPGLPYLIRMIEWVNQRR
jgi:peroxiredoxin